MTDLNHIDCTSEAFAILSADLLRNGVALRFTAQGDSMHPLTRGGDVLFIRPTQPEMIKVSDVVLFVNQYQRAIVHRVTRKKSFNGIKFFTIQGDNALKPDGVFTEANIIGKLDRLSRDGQSILMNDPRMQFLGWLAVLRSRWNFRQGNIYKLLSSIIKHRGLFNRYIK